MAFSFASPPASNPFQTPAPAAPNPFQTPAPAQAPSLSPSPFQFNLQQQQPPQQQVAPAAQPQPQQQKQQLMLYTMEGKPAGYNTKWEELHAESQKALLQIEDKIREYRDESERLDQCSRLYDSSISNINFELDASRIAQELGGTTTVMEREKVSIQELMTVVNEMMWNTEFAIRSYMMLRPRFSRPGAGAANGGSSNPAGNPSNQPVSVAPTIDFYSGVPKRPSLFMQQTVTRFECYLAECCKWIGELEQLFQMENNKRSSDSLESLPKVMSNVHDYFIYVASKVENLHQYVGSMKTEYLNEQRRMGIGNDPFLEANRREAAKQEAAARRVHPTLHLPAPAQPTTQIAAPATSQPQQSFPSGTASSSAFSAFGTPASAPSSSSLFSTPTTPAPSGNLFGTAGSAQLTTPFGTASTPTLGSTPAPSGFGTSNISFASPSTLGGTPLFSTPFGGGATASGSSFGGASKGRSKPRGRR
ncbi:nuclear pore complex protein NUP58-like [Phragmites australis]|uniref:nuclear pore complex protein NUP58-like n=1 Tax=Phragmites australis TaxID=29695 RepID=UPI002D7701C3|nr:nuclear pore complex protein NUP58-like [Phragmites australis]XP_062200095.1 nuclear pore complex protein NUP58-like [Phragmites australis]XP_062200096.1 nuclear pore complex protein NUP58-like [Phragmites australis]